MTQNNSHSVNLYQCSLVLIGMGVQIKDQQLINMFLLQTILGGKSMSSSFCSFKRLFFLAIFICVALVAADVYTSKGGFESKF